MSGRASAVAHSRWRCRAWHGPIRRCCLPTCLPSPLAHPADWDARQEDPQSQALWEQDWDDDSTQDDFSQRLKAELAKQQQQPGA